jgi:DNA replication protein DnaC
MLNDMTLDKLHQLKLQGMVQAYIKLRDNPNHQLTWQESLGQLIDQETTHRHNKRLQRLLKIAKLRYPSAMLEDVRQEHKRALTDSQWQWVKNGQWLTQYQPIIYTGPTGIGKTFLACACAQWACRQGFTTRYFRLSRLLQQLHIARADGSYGKLMGQLLKTQCLVIDDWGIDTIDAPSRTDLLEIMDERYQQRSLIIATQLPVEHWHDYLGDHTIADAILDRIIHHAQIFNLQGDSMRKIIDAN